MKTKANGGGPNTKPFNSRDMSLVTISESVIAHLYSTMSEGVSFSSSSIHEYDLDPWPRPVVSALNCCASSSSPLSFDSQDFSMYKTTILICSSLFIILAATYFLLLLFDGLISLSLAFSSSFLLSSNQNSNKERSKGASILVKSPSVLRFGIQSL